MQVRAGLAVLVALAAAPAALADTLKVPSEAYPTIQSAVDAADNGDTIVVAKGEYAELVTISNKSEIEIRGKGWPVIQGPDAGFLINNGSYAVRIRGFELDQADVVAEFCDNVTLTRLRIHDVQTPVDSTEMHGLVISKCEFQDVSGTAIIDDLSTGLVVEKCLFENIWAHAVWLSVGGGVGTDGAVLSKNRVLFAGSGFTLGGSDALVEKNRMEGLLSHGVSAGAVTDCSRATIAKNRIATTGTAAISGSHPDLVIEKNVLTGGGISLSADGHVLAGNKLYDSTQHAVILTGKATVERNKVRGAAGYGIIVQADETTVTRNTVIDVNENGIEIAASGCAIERNRSTGAGSMGFFVDGIGNVLTANRASGSGDFDLADMAAEGVNTYDANRFGTIDFEYVP